VSGTPTTLAGYGITDAASDAELAAHTGSSVHPWLDQSQTWTANQAIAAGLWVNGYGGGQTVFNYLGQSNYLTWAQSGAQFFRYYDGSTSIHVGRWGLTGLRIGDGSVASYALDVVGTARAGGNLICGGYLNCEGYAYIGSGSSNAVVRIDGGAGSGRAVQFYTGGVVRWWLGANQTAESGANAGSDLALYAYADDGSYLDAPMVIKRAAGGWIAMGRSLEVRGELNIVSSLPRIRLGDTDGSDATWWVQAGDVLHCQRRDRASGAFEGTVYQIDHANLTVSYASAYSLAVGGALDVGGVVKSTAAGISSGVPGSFLAESAVPTYAIHETDADPDEGRWDISGGNGTLRFRAVNGAITSAHTFLQVNRTLASVTSAVWTCDVDLNGHDLTDVGTAHVGSLESDGAIIMGTSGAPGADVALRHADNDAALFVIGGTTLGVDPSIQLLGSADASLPDTIRYRTADHIFTDASTGSTFATLNGTGLGIGVSPSYPLDVLGASRLDGVVNIVDATDATSLFAASTIVSGGAAIAKKLRVGSDAHVAGNTFVSGQLYANSHTTSSTSYTGDGAQQQPLSASTSFAQGIWEMIVCNDDQPGNDHPVYRAVIQYINTIGWRLQPTYVSPGWDGTTFGVDPSGNIYHNNTVNGTKYWAALQGYYA
jgi:hypothetical protein